MLDPFSLTLTPLTLNPAALFSHFCQTRGHAAALWVCMCVCGGGFHSYYRVLHLWVCDMCLQLFSTTSKRFEWDERIQGSYKRLIIKDETCIVPGCFRHFQIIHYVTVEATCVIIHPISLCNYALLFLFFMLPSSKPNFVVLVKLICWVDVAKQAGRIRFKSSQTGQGSKWVIFKRVNWVAGRVGSSLPIFFKQGFFFPITKTNQWQPV